LVITLLLLVVSLFQVHELQAEAAFEWGRQVNCDPELTTPSAVVTTSFTAV
jgi:hypothetical protein